MEKLAVLRHLKPAVNTDLPYRLQILEKLEAMGLVERAERQNPQTDRHKPRGAETPRLLPPHQKGQTPPKAGKGAEPLEKPPEAGSRPTAPRFI
ncbi:hypothetical protein Pisl_1946 [Pyrobaculum islandicum DSM 4184]|uniref:Uncharacterized protein n=1 Tax=Pyrobaculum islandicum (strain DSM 4184 / JCM 9189 / GEO3) TaxID=384616 RepID=A1RVW1_PYRIL|nr:hypothetical protein Pisl_1946 [Pyrobaculum islandicum DSM 4184]